jgi:hypothetical protein
MSDYCNKILFLTTFHTERVLIVQWKQKVNLRNPPSIRGTQNSSIQTTACTYRFLMMLLLTRGGAYRIVQFESPYTLINVHQQSSKRVHTNSEVTVNV